ncbi:MAG: BlaI/MecI/CopY family transcriptional regulator [Lentimicrobiaceae bacterium]
MKELTRSEEQVMQILWRVGKGYVHELLQYFPEPKPAYNTVSTFIRILEKKGFVDHENINKSHLYYPMVTKSEYAKQTFKTLLKGYFSNSYKQMVSFFADDDKLSISELEEMKKLIDKQILEKQKANES